MRIDVHHFIHQDSDVKLDRILALLTKGFGTMALDLTKLQDAVRRDTEVDTSAKTLIEEIAAALKATGGNQAAVDALADELLAHSGSLADSVAANTVAAPPTP